MTAKNSDICIADVEKELMRLWEAQKDQNLIRASLFNLVIYAHRSQGRISAGNRATIVEKFPCRIIFMQGNPDPNMDYLKVWVTNAISLAMEKSPAIKSILKCPQISTFASLLFFLPILFRICLSSCFGVRTLPRNMISFPSFNRYASRLIFDSDCTMNLQSFCRKCFKNWTIAKLKSGI